MRLWDRRWRTTWEGPCYDWRCNFCINIIPEKSFIRKSLFGVRRKTIPSVVAGESVEKDQSQISS